MTEVQYNNPISPAEVFLILLRRVLCLDSMPDGTFAVGEGQSPNNIKFLHVSQDNIEVVYHVPVEGAGYSSAWSLSHENVDPGHVRDSIERVLGERTCQNLEGVFYQNNFEAGKVVGEYFQAKGSGGRFHILGAIPPVPKGVLFDDEGGYTGEQAGLPSLESFEISTDEEDNSGISKPWWEKVGTHEVYHFDSQVKEKLSKLREEYRNASAEEEILDDLLTDDEAIAVEEVRVVENGGIEEGTSSLDSGLKEAINYYEATISGTAYKILEEYDKIFASGYELNKPAGILVKNMAGRYRVVSINGKNKIVEEQSKIINQLGKSLDERLNLTYSPRRGMKDIAEVIAQHRTPMSDHLCFPYKLLEYAYGRQHCVDESQMKEGIYEPHSNSVDWWKYRSEEVLPSVKNLIRNVITAVIVKNELEDYESDEAEKLVDIALQNILKSMTSCVLVSTLDVFKGVPAKLKVRVLDSYGGLKGTGENIATEVFLKALNTTGGKDSSSPPIVRKGIFVEYVHEYNHTLANAEPLFAPNALYALIEKGETVSWSNLILGKDSDDNILKASPEAGVGISFLTALLHWIVAGSRSGKGVMTMNITTGILMSRRALFYLDDKPDIASLLRYLGPEGFILNGPSISYSKEAGFDYYKQFTEANQWFKKEHIPEYLVPNIFSEYSYSQMGVMTYARGVLFTMGIILARIKAEDKKHLLGGDEGIAIVYDELANASEKFNTWYYRNVRGNLANTAYAEEFKNHEIAQREYEEKLAEYEANGGSGPKPRAPEKIKAAPVSKEQYWFTTFRNALESSFLEVYSESRAGLRNIEAGVSDIFALTQELPAVAEVGSNPEDLLVKRNKTDNNPNTSPKNREILASLIGVSGMDGFFGYNQGWRNVLGQKNAGTIAADKLDSKARNFAYVSNVNTDNYDDIVNGSPSVANSAIYFKPFLLLIEGNEPFTTKAKEYVEAAGLEWNDIVSRNEKIPGSGVLDPAVGYAGYLKELGMSPEDIRSVLAKSGQIAQNVVNALGYPGSWMDFIHDLRPEWIFSVKDIREAMQGIPLHGKHRSDIREFITVYPEEFPNISVPGEDNGGTGGRLRQGTMVDDYQDYYGAGGVENLEVGDGGVGTAGLPSAVGAVGAGNGYVMRGMGSMSPETPDVSFIVGEPGVGAGSPGTAGVPIMNNAYDSGYGVGINGSGSQEGYKVDAEDDVIYDVEVGQPDPYRQNVVTDNGRYVGEDTLSVGEGSTTPLTGAGSTAVAGHLFNQNVDPDLTDTSELSYGQGGFNNTFQPEHVVNRSQWSDVGSVEWNGGGAPLSRNELSALVTQAVLSKYPLGGVQTLGVSGGVLIVNGSPVNISFHQKIIQRIGTVEAAKLQAGLIAELFNWSLLENMVSLQFLKVDSGRFFRGTVLRAAGLKTGRDGGVRNVFNSIDSLQKLNLAGNVYTRDGLGEETSGTRFLDGLKSQYLAERNSFFITSISARGTRGLYQWTVGRFRSGKKLQGAVGIAAVGAAAGITATSGALGVLWEGGKMVKNTLAEALRSE